MTTSWWCCTPGDTLTDFVLPPEDLAPHWWIALSTTRELDDDAQLYRAGAVIRIPPRAVVVLMHDVERGA